MGNLSLNLDRCPAELRRGLSEIVAEYPDRFDKDSAAVTFQQDAAMQDGGLSASRSSGSIEVRYGRKVDAFRALGRLLGETGDDGSDFSETPLFDMLGIMIDVSRNGVINPDAAKAMMRRCALMGINTIMLYAEDTYEVPGEPFFGYLRGRYTHEEMKSLDDYADALGIEMFPCIQTLAHLEQILQWPAYAGYRDTNNVVLAGEERTYALIEKMIAAAVAPFRSRRIHLGMDEAHGIGSGEYRKRHGEKRPFDILNAHLARVRDICRRHGLKPMIWSDMYFRLGSKTNDYYDRNCVIPPDVSKKIPPDIELVYWDYYNDYDFYCEWIDRHRGLGFEPIVAPGVWTWNHFWAALPFAFTATDACMRACKEKGVRQAFLTMWGDDGMECDVFSALPGLQLFAEHGYADSVDEALLRANFRGACNADLDDWLKAAEVDSVPCIADPGRSQTNVSKWLLWDDPLLGLMEPQIADISLREHYAELAETLFAAAEKTPHSRRLLFPAHLARALSLKCELRRNLVEAYTARDSRRIKEIVEGDLTSLRKAVAALWKCHRDMWLQTYKPFGLEVIEHRYGGLRARLDSLSDRLQGFVEGRVASIPEFEANLEKIFDGDLKDVPNIRHPRSATPSYIK